MSTYVPPQKSSTIFEESTSSLDLTGKVVVITGTEMMAGAQSAEDGAVPLLMCMASPDAESGDFFGPSIAGVLGPYTTGPAEKHEPEPFCTSPENTRLLWSASEQAIGETLVVG